VARAKSAQGRELLKLMQAGQQCTSVSMCSVLSCLWCLSCLCALVKCSFCHVGLVFAKLNALFVDEFARVYVSWLEHIAFKIVFFLHFFYETRLAVMLHLVFCACYRFGAAEAMPFIVNYHGWMQAGE